MHKREDLNSNPQTPVKEKRALTSLPPITIALAGGGEGTGGPWGLLATSPASGSCSTLFQGKGWRVKQLWTLFSGLSACAHTYTSLHTCKRVCARTHTPLKRKSFNFLISANSSDSKYRMNQTSVWAFSLEASALALSVFRALCSHLRSSSPHCVHLCNPSTDLRIQQTPLELW